MSCKSLLDDHFMVVRRGPHVPDKGWAKHKIVSKITSEEETRLRKIVLGGG